MPQFKCAKCDETMSSKNPSCRSVFQSDGTAAMMTNIVNVDTERDEKTGRRTVTFVFPYSDTGTLKDPGIPMDDDELEIQCMKNVRGLTDEQLMHWLCNHEWVLTPGKITVT